MTGFAAPDQAFQIRMEPIGIVRLTWTRGLRINGALADAAMVAVNELNGDEVRPLLVEMAGVDSPTAEARERFGHPCTASRIALVGESVVDRVRAAFAPRAFGRGFPVSTRFFRSEPEAVAWLLDGSAE